MVSCAGWRPSKRGWAIKRLAEELLRLRPDVTITILGPFKGETLPNMKALGTVEPSRLKTIYRDNRVFFHPAFQDPCPNTVVEAVAHGLFVVGSTTGGMKDIVRSNGVLIEEPEVFHRIEQPPDPSGDWMDQATQAVLIGLEQEDQLPLRRDLDIRNVAAEYALFWKSLLRNG